MEPIFIFLVIYAISCIAYELNRLLAIIYRKHPKYPLWYKVLGMVLFVFGIFGVYTIGLIDNYSTRILSEWHQEEMKKLRVIAELQGYPDPYTEKRYDLECSYFDHDGEFNIYLWKQHEYRKLGL